MEAKPKKLKIHNRDRSEEDLLLNLEEFPKGTFKVGDIVEIRALDEQAKPFYLKVKDDLQQKGVSVLSDVAQVFGLASMKMVSVSKMDRESVAVDLVELTIKDQRLSRSDMWRFSTSLMDSCVYTGKKIQYGQMRAQVQALWSKENTVDSGLVNTCTRMWEFDANGTLYFDKTLLSFLKKLFHHWTTEGCTHFMTIIFFSRTYYERNTSVLSHFPVHMRTVLRQDYRGVFYQDFFEVILEGQQPMDWGIVAKELKRSFKDYRERTDCAEDDNGTACVKGRISRAPQGNVLECLNLTSNVYAKNYVNPSFHCTGQQTVIITPGVGVFEVDRELARITNEKVMDLGIGSDIVSLTEQPLHAVPLFKFQSVTGGEEGTVVDDYTIPHWINYSYYDPSSLWAMERFQPRIRLPDYMVNCHLKECDSKRRRGMMRLPSSHSRANTPSMLFRRESDFDDYDAKVFVKVTKCERRALLGVPGQMSSPAVEGLRRHRSNEHLFGSWILTKSQLMPTPPKFERIRLLSNREEVNQTPVGHAVVPRRVHSFMSESEESPSHRPAFPDSDLESTLEAGTTPQSPALGMQPRLVARGSPSKVAGRLFINPFQPNALPLEISTNKRRWMHAFPTTSKGHAFQPHHVMQKEGEGGVRICSQESRSGSVASEAEESASTESDTFQERGETSDTELVEISMKEEAHTSRSNLTSPSSYLSPNGSVISLASNESSSSAGGGGGRGGRGGGGKGVDVKKKKHKPTSKRPLFEISTSAVQPKVLDNFAPIRRTGVDWKALTRPACLPVTTDYFPSERTLADDYTVNHYTLLPSQVAESRDELESQQSHPRLTSIQCFRELISQRLSKGFQIVLSDGASLFSLNEKLQKIVSETKSKKKKKMSAAEANVIVRMSLGRVYHFLTFSSQSYPGILVSVHRAKHTPQFGSCKYSYSLRPCGQSDHQVVQCTFDHDKMEQYNWNFLDQHIMGHEDFDMLSDGMKSCQSRFLLLPMECSNTFNSIEEEESRGRSQVSGFVRFFEFLNSLRRASGLSRRSSTDSLSGRMSRVTSRDSLLKHSMRSRQSSQLSLLQAPGTSITEVDEGHSTFTRTPSNDASNPSSRATSPCSALFYIVGSPNPRGSSDRGTPQRISSTERQDSLLSSGHYRRQGGQGEDLPERLTTPDEREELEMSLEVYSPSFQRQHEDKDQATETGGGDRDTPTLDSTAEDSSITLVKSDTTGVTVTETHSLSRQTSAASNIRELEEGRVPQTETFAEIVKAMMDTKNMRGIDFVSCPRTQLRSHCFLALEAVEWMKEHVQGVHTVEEAVWLGQHMVDKGVLVHASGDKAVRFDVGFFLFCINNIGRTPESSLSSTAPSLDHSFVIIEGSITNFRRQWFEAGIVNTDSSEPSTRLMNESPTALSAGSNSPGAPLMLRSLDDTRLRSSSSNASDQEWTCTKTVDLNPDPQGSSDRPEWTTVHYDAIFRPQVAFQMEFQWVVTTATVLAKQLSQWARRAEMCGFNLLPVPTWEHLEQNPFSKPQSIPLLFNFERFGFLLDPSSTSDDNDCLYNAKQLNKSLSACLGKNGISWHSNPVYVHHSGACLVKPIMQAFSPLQPRPSSSSSHLFRTDSEGTIQATTPLGFDYDDVFSARRLSRSSVFSHSKLRHSTPCTSPDHAPSPSGMNAMYSFLWYSTNLAATQKPSSTTKFNVATFQKEFMEYCAAVNDHFQELLCQRELTPFDSMSAGSNV